MLRVIVLLEGEPLPCLRFWMLWIGFLLELTLYFELFFYSDVSRGKQPTAWGSYQHTILLDGTLQVMNNAWFSSNMMFGIEVHQTREYCFSQSEGPFGVFFFTEERIESCHTTIKSRSMECCSNVCPSVRFSYLHILSWSSTRVTIRFLVTSVDKALLHQLLSLARRPALGRILVVSNFFHLRVTETTCFCEPSVKQNFFSELFPRCVAWCKLVSELYRQLFWPQGLVFALICIITC